jgi:hypothetical protein
MSKRTIIIGVGLVLLLLVGILVIREVSNRGGGAWHESLLVVRPFKNALLAQAFERELRQACPGMTRLGFAVSTLTETTSQGTKSQTNGVIRVVLAAATAAEAEQMANRASNVVRTLLQQRYGVSATPLGSAHTAPASALQEPLRLGFGDATPGDFPVAGRVSFPTAAVSIDPGEGWLRTYIIGREPNCDLLLTGTGKFNGGRLRAFRLRPALTNALLALEELRPRVGRDQGLIESSWKEEPFATEAGLHGFQASFTQKYPSPFGSGMVFMTQTTHLYLVTNQLSQWVCLRYINASSSRERPRDIAGQSEAVQQLIRRTLRTE